MILLILPKVLFFPTDKKVHLKLAKKAKLNADEGLDKLKATICLRVDIQVKDGTNT